MEYMDQILDTEAYIWFTEGVQLQERCGYETEMDIAF